MISRFKNFAVQQSINHPKRTLIISLFTTLIMATGLKHFVIEDDMMKMIPKTVKTRIVWEEVKDEFGNTELVFVAFGNDSIDLFNSESLADLWDFTTQLELLPEVEDVRSLTNLNKMENDDGFLLIDDLVASRDLSQQQIQEIKDYLNRNDDIRKRVISSKDNYFNGFPALWNLLILYFYILQTEQIVNLFVVIVSLICTFLPIKYVHPLRVKNYRFLAIFLFSVWGITSVILIYINC